MSDFAERLLAASRKVYFRYRSGKPPEAKERWVSRFACSVPVKGRFIYEPPFRCRTAATGRAAASRRRPGPEQVGLSREALDSHYLLQIAMLDPRSTPRWKRQFVLPHFDIALSPGSPTSTIYRDLPGLEVRPPDVHAMPSASSRTCWRPLRARPASRAGAPPVGRRVSCGGTPTSSMRPSTRPWARSGPSFFRTAGQLIFKMVGYAEQNVEYYSFEDFAAHVWIAHQRYPTKGRVWHPGGAHPFRRPERGAGTQRRLRQLPLRVRVPAAAAHPPAFLPTRRFPVQLFDCGPRLPVPAGVHHRGPGSHHGAGFRPVAGREAGDLPADPGHPYSRLAGRSVVFHHRAQPSRRFPVARITDTAMRAGPRCSPLDSGEVQMA